MHLHIPAIVFLIVENLSKVFAQGVPMTPCPKIFQYRFNGSEWFGILAVHNPDHDQPLNVRVILSVGGKLATNYFGEIQLLTRGQYLSDEPVLYKIKFPISPLPPKLLQIAVNNQVICVGAPDLTILVTQIQLQHTRKYTFIIPDVSTPIQPASSPFSLDTDVMGLDGVFSAGEPKGITRPLQPTNSAVNVKHLPASTSKDKLTTQNLSEYCGTIDGRIHFDVLQTLKQPRTPGAASKDNADNGDSLLSNESGELKEGEIKRPLIVSNMSDDSAESTRKHPSIARGAWPWLAAVYVNNLTSLIYHCGGTLVSSRIIISAAHCFQLFNQKYTANEVFVFLGRHNLMNLSEEGALAAAVEDIFIHPHFTNNLNSYDADIAVLVLKHEVRFSSFIRPACLWSGPTESKYMEGEQGVVVGWSAGSKHFTQFNTLPKLISAPIVSNSVCFQANAKYDSLSSNRTFCAGVMLTHTAKGRTTSLRSDENLDMQRQTYYGPCTGDSGAGLMIYKNNRWMLRGLVSGLLPLQPNIDPTSDPNCSINQLVIYTDVAKFLDWIGAFII